MKTILRLLPIVLVGAMTTSGANADDDRQTRIVLTDSSSPIHVALQDDPAAESPSDLTAIPEPEAPSVADVIKSDKSSGKGDGCGKGCGGCKSCGWGCSLFNGCGSPPWGLPQANFLQNNRIKVGGWLQQGITVNDHNSADGFNGPVATNDMNREYQMNQLWLYAVRPVDTKGCGWDIGGRVDAMYGTDWRFGINNGLETRLNGFNGQSYGVVIPQAYLEVAVNNLSVKLGHFAAILDYELIPAPANPFYSHSYSYPYMVPTLVTGALGDWKVNDRLSVQAGVHRGWAQFEDNNDKLDIMAGIKWQSCDKRTSVAWALSSGAQWPAGGNPPFVPAPGDDHNRFVYSLVVQHQFTDRFKYVLVHNLGREDGIGGPAGGQSAEWYGINQYFLYSLTKCLSANLRAEWMRDDDGRRVAGPGNITGVRAWSGSDYAGDFLGITAGLNWRPTSNWIVRPEVRYDRFNGPAGVTGLLPFGGNRDQLTFGVDAILLF